MATDPRVETLKHLASIDTTLKAILLVLSEGRNAAPSPSVNLDGPHGDPIVKAKDPRDWSGEPMTGRTFSECPPEYLDLLADRYDYFVTKAQQDLQSAGDASEVAAAEKSLKYAKLDAARARGWAARLRSGWTPAAVQADGEPTW